MEIQFFPYVTKNNADYERSAEFEIALGFSTVMPSEADWPNGQSLGDVYHNLAAS
jgi:hypothetical protein